MKLIFRILMALLAAALLGAVVAPWVFTALRGAGWLEIPFDKVLNRCVLAWLIVLLVVFRKSLFAVPLSQVGMARTPGWKGDLAYGLLFGLVSFIALNILFYFLDARDLHLRLHSPKFLRRLLEFGLAASFIGVFEEIFFRGFILQALLQTQRASLAVATSSLFYALTHFLNAGDSPVPEPVTLIYSFQSLLRFLEPLGELEKVLPHFLGLFLLGVVLAAGYLKTGRLYFSIGLHASWVYAIKMDGFFVKPTPLGGEHWFFGDGKIVNGIVGWDFLIFCMLWIYFWVPWRKKKLDV